MKTNSVLFLVSLAVLATSASAAVSRVESDVVVLPTLVVTAPRYSPVEKQINSSLRDFRQQASAPVAIAMELTALKEELKAGFERAERQAKATRVAKL